MNKTTIPPFYNAPLAMKFLGGQDFVAAGFFERDNQIVFVWF